jgi:hypothetical protein
MGIHVNTLSTAVRKELSRTALAVFSAFATCLICSGAELVTMNVTAGRNLQTFATITLKEPAPEGGLELTVRSSDSQKVLLSKSPDDPGSALITLKVAGKYRESPEFWVQALADSGSVLYTASAPGFSAASGTVTLAPSGIVLMGPFRAPKFPTTTGAEPSRLTAYSALLNSSFQFVDQQLVAGGLTVNFDVRSSNTAVGTIANSPLTISGGSSSATTEFLPSGAGETILSVAAPPGFSTPAQLAAITAVVSAPGIAVSDQIAIGQDLQVGGLISLGEAAPADGLDVTLMSADPKRLLLSTSATEIGSKSISIKIPAGGSSATYYLQALGGSGIVTYTATASGFRSRTGTIGLTPSGVVIAPKEYGPPDEAELHRKEEKEVPRGFVASVSKSGTVPLVVWTVQLDPTTLRGADVTVQPLRAGRSVTVEVKCDNPAVGKVVSPVTIVAASEHAVTDFTPTSEGSAVITALIPKGFTRPSNSTSVPAIVIP